MLSPCSRSLYRSSEIGSFRRKGTLPDRGALFQVSDTFQFPVLEWQGLPSHAHTRAESVSSQTPHRGSDLWQPLPSLHTPRSRRPGSHCLIIKIAFGRGGLPRRGLLRLPQWVSHLVVACPPSHFQFITPRKRDVPLITRATGGGRRNLTSVPVSETVLPASFLLVPFEIWPVPPLDAVPCFRNIGANPSVHRRLENALTLSGRPL